jgi:hypothetical protein
MLCHIFWIFDILYHDKTHYLMLWHIYNGFPHSFMFWHTFSGFDTLSQVVTYILIFQRNFSGLNTFSCFDTIYQVLKHFLWFWQIFSGFSYFWQRQRCTRRGFYTPPPKKWIKKVVKKPNRLLPYALKFCLAFGRTVLCFLYAHYTNKINKQKVVNKPRRILPNVLKFLAFGLTVFRFLYAHY